MIHPQVRQYLKLSSSILLDGFYGLLTFIVAATLSWLILAQLNFLYGFWHDHTGIEQTIAEFGPQNVYRQDFANTSRQQRIELFAQINVAIHNRGSGLEDISYQVSGNTFKLLHQAEIVHLNDVAQLISRLFFMAAIAFIAWVILTYLKLKSALGLPSIKRQAGSLGFVFACVSILILLLGATDLFYWLHTLVFPDNHQWFFYYQESLMSTMMQAPTLFGWIGATWAVVSVLIFIVVQAVLQLIRKRITTKTGKK